MRGEGGQAAPKVRLYVEDALVQGAELELAPTQAHYVGAVLRLKAGAALGIFNGRDGAWLARLATVGKGEATIKLERQIAPQRPSPDVWLLFAPVKHGRIDFLVEKATELGVSRLMPVFTTHAQAERVNIARLRARAIEAAEQCERLDVPAIDDAVELGAALDRWPATRLLLVCDEAGSAPISEVLEFERKEGLTAGGIAVLVGPEGGFAPADRKVLALVSARRPVSLGPRILRAETAALAALACVMAALADWSLPPRAL